MRKDLEMDLFTNWDWVMDLEAFKGSRKEPWRL
jgi:hypothetical protein